MKKDGELVFTFGTPAKQNWTEEQVIDGFISGLLVILKDIKGALKGFSGLIANIAGRKSWSHLVVKVYLKEVKAETARRGG